LKAVMNGRYDPKLQRQAGPVLAAARNARKVKNWKLASMHYDEVINLDAKIFADVAIEQFEMMLIEMGDKAKAYDYARTVLMGQKFASDAGALAELAKRIATDPKIDKANQDLNFALEAAEAAHRLVGDEEPEALATLALVRFARGEIEQAVGLQKQAWFNASPKQKAEFKRTLDSYQNANQRAAAVTKKAS
jgi:hypothetical protein